MGRHSLDVDEACGLDVLQKGVAQGDVLRAFVEAKLVVEAQCRCTVGEDVDQRGRSLEDVKDLAHGRW